MFLKVGKYDILKSILFCSSLQENPEHSRIQSQTIIRWIQQEREEGILSNNHGNTVAAEQDKQMETFLLIKLPLTDFIYQGCNYG